MTTETKVKSMKRILKVKIKRMIDNSPDTSWMGEYDTDRTSEFSIDRKHSLDCVVNGGPIETAGPDLPQDESDQCGCGERGDWERYEFQYFNPSFNYVDKQGKPTGGLTPDEVRKYVRQDYERQEALNRGDWSFEGVRAEAEIQLTGDLCQTITSGGLWGIESDSGKDYFQEVEQEQLEELKTELHAMGFSKRAISAAFRDVERGRD